MLRTAALTLALLLESFGTFTHASARGGGVCDYCGCRGGPGYRGPDGKCVGHRNMTKVCGSPPSKHCKKEG